MWFSYIDARYQRWYKRVNLREIEIRKFLSKEEYILPINKNKMSFEKCLIDEKLSFPIFDLSGEYTFGNDNNYKWEKSLAKNYFDKIPLFFYWSQILASVLFSSLEYKNMGHLKYSWLPVSVAFLVIVFLYIYAQIRKKKIISKNK